MIAMGTGSRSLATASLDHKEDVLHRTKNALLTSHTTQVISGMAEGFDACIALAAIQLDIPFIAAIPSPDYRNYYWRDHSLYGYDRTETFDYYIEQAQEVVYVCDSHQYGKANFTRNKWMVDHSNMALVYKPESRGTSHAVKLLDKADIPYLIIA